MFSKRLREFDDFWYLLERSAAFTLVPCCLHILLLDSQPGYVVVLRLEDSFSPSLITPVVC